MPSEPAKIPIIKKSMSVGTPSLVDVLPAKMLNSSSIEDTKRILPEVTSIIIH
jgi:hypothetical protein